MKIKSKTYFAILTLSLICNVSSAAETTLNINLHNKTLSEAVNVINASGGHLSINESLKKDKVDLTYHGSDWAMAAYEFLSGYNIVAVHEGGKIKSIYISGRNGSGLNQAKNTAPLVEAQQNQLLFGMKC